MTLFDVEWTFKGGLLGAGLVLGSFVVEWLMRTSIRARRAKIKEEAELGRQGETERGAASPVSTSAEPQGRKTTRSAGTGERVFRRITHCWRCKTHLNSSRHEECPACGWIICPECGACGCGYYRL
jgi:hypothetical protein